MGNFDDKNTQYNNDQDNLNSEPIDQPFADIDREPIYPYGSRDEETASELAADNITEDNDDRDAGIQTNNAVGWVALALAIISFFIMPIVLGVAAIIVGFVARARHAEWLGNTAIAIGII